MQPIPMLAQVDPEKIADLATREWTIGALSLFFLVVSWAGFIFAVRRMILLWRADTQALVEARNLCEQGRARDLEEQVKKRGGDVERLEQALADSAAAQRETAQHLSTLGGRLSDLEQRCEAIDRRTEATFVIIDRRTRPRDEG